MEAMNLLAGGAVLGVVASSWAKIKAVAWRFTNLLIQDVDITDATTSDAVVDYLLRNFKKVGNHDREFDCARIYLRPHKRYGIFGYEKSGNHSIWFRDGWRIIYYQVGAKSKEGGSSGGRKYLLSMRGCFDFDQIIAQAMADRNESSWRLYKDISSEAVRHFVKHIPNFDDDKSAEADPSQWGTSLTNRPIGYRQADLGYKPESGVGKLDNLFFPTSVTLMIDEIKNWIKSKDVYEELGIPWKRGWLLYGPGGTGKTGLAAAFAHDLDLPIFVYNLCELGNLAFMSEWRKMLSHTPCIALIEDIDNVFHGRDNIGSGISSFGSMFSRIGKFKSPSSDGDGDKEVSNRYGSMLSFDVLLNCLDGVERCDGLFTIITTNHIEHIDPALGQPVQNDDGTSTFISSRPGRIDKAIELTYLEQGVKEKMARHILRRFPNLIEDYVAELRAHPIRETPAQFQDRCGQYGLRKHWEAQGSATPALKLCSGG